MSSRVTDVLAIGTGGTIQNSSNGYRSLEALLDSLRSSFPSACEASFDGMNLTVSELNPQASSESDEDRCLEIGRLIRERSIRRPDAAYVVTMGTVAAAEMAYYLHLNLPVTGPIVLTAAQRPGDAPGSDGAANLLDAFRVAKHPGMRGMGCVLVMDRKIHSARDFRKRGSSIGDFVSVPFGPLGHVDADGIWIYRIPTRRHTRTSRVNGACTELPRVDIIYSHMGAAADLVLSAARSGTAGIVIGGYASNGRAASSQRHAIQEAQAAGVPFVATSQGLDGGRVRPPAPDGLIAGDNLSPAKARILLQLGLAHDLATAELVKLYETH